MPSSSSWPEPDRDEAAADEAVALHFHSAPPALEGAAFVFADLAGRVLGNAGGHAQVLGDGQADVLVNGGLELLVQVYRAPASTRRG